MVFDFVLGRKFLKEDFLFKLNLNFLFFLLNLYFLIHFISDKIAAIKTENLSSKKEKIVDNRRISKK